LNSHEGREGCPSALELIENEPQVHILNSNKAFTYDFAFSVESEQEQVYEEAVRPIVKKLFKGFNVTVLAYGQTGSGKMNTMGTSYRSSMDRELEGVIPRAVREILEQIKEKSSAQFIVKMSFIELYDEQFFDLLSEKVRREDTIVDLREDSKGYKDSWPYRNSSHFCTLIKIWFRIADFNTRLLEEDSDKMTRHGVV